MKNLLATHVGLNMFGVCWHAVIGLLMVSSVRATPYYYRFEGTILSSYSYNASYPVSGLDAVLGVTPVSYLFEVDFERDVRTGSTSTGTWYYFYADLLGEGYMVTEMGSTSSELRKGFNVDYISTPDEGLITGGRNGVRIASSASLTSDWRVQDWKVGDEFSLTDLAVPPGGSGAVYYYGEVALVSISVIPEPTTFTLLGLGSLALVMGRRRR